ncbi:hypothetical protein HK405_006102 [Cladochytrium tenue]|nr:hypothetical protein HK405_006102 [Cladochytrium tenue]
MIEGSNGQDATGITGGSDGGGGALWALLMLADSALPTGGFVASCGLEAAVQQMHLGGSRGASSSSRGGIVPQSTTSSSVDDLPAFVRASLHAAAASSAPFVRGVWMALARFVPRRPHGPRDEEGGGRRVSAAVAALAALDAAYDAMVGANHVARRASRAQGAAYVALMDRGLVDGLDDDDGSGGDGDEHKADVEVATAEAREVLARFKREIRGERTAGHLPVALGAAYYCMGLSLEKSEFLFLFQHARSLVSSAVRLNVVGPYAGQLVLRAAAGWSRAAAREAAARVATRRCEAGLDDNADGFWDGWEDEKEAAAAQNADSVEGYAVRATREACTTAPVLEVVQGNHDRLYSRLFNS